MSDIQLSKKEILKGPHDIKINHLADSFITKLTCGEGEQTIGLKVPSQPLPGYVARRSGRGSASTDDLGRPRSHILRGLDFSHHMKAWVSDVDYSLNNLEK